MTWIHWLHVRTVLFCIEICSVLVGITLLKNMFLRTHVRYYYLKSCLPISNFRNGSNKCTTKELDNGSGLLPFGRRDHQTRTHPLIHLRTNTAAAAAITRYGVTGPPIWHHTLSGTVPGNPPSLQRRRPLAQTFGGKVKEICGNSRATTTSDGCSRECHRHFQEFNLREILRTQLN